MASFPAMLTQTPAAAPIERQAVQTFHGRRILLVEDNPVNQRVAQRTLQKLAADIVATPVPFVEKVKDALVYRAP